MKRFNTYMPGRLTLREIEVLQLLASGASNKMIAATMVISMSTVKTHISNIFSKLDAQSRTEAVRIGVQRGLVSLQR
jgi:two-component system, NarL family, response regulator YdfI